MWASGQRARYNRMAMGLQPSRRPHRSLGSSQVRPKALAFGASTRGFKSHLPCQALRLCQSSKRVTSVKSDHQTMNVYQAEDPMVRMPLGRGISGWRISNSFVPIVTALYTTEIPEHKYKEGRSQWCETGFERLPNLTVDGSTPLSSSRVFKESCPRRRICRGPAWEVTGVSWSWGSFPHYPSTLRGFEPRTLRHTFNNQPEECPHEHPRAERVDHGTGQGKG